MWGILADCRDYVKNRGVSSVLGQIGIEKYNNSFKIYGITVSGNGKQGHQKTFDNLPTNHQFFSKKVILLL